ncbi:MAG: hypothetical protein ACYTF1_13260 [Planctomycetota bacterium]|jgi:hypothetical protein
MADTNKPLLGSVTILVILTTMVLILSFTAHASSAVRINEIGGDTPVEVNSKPAL